MPGTVLSPPNAILFVLDPTNSAVVIPPYIEGHLTAANETCVSVGTQADVDGDTEVSLQMAGRVPPGLEHVFAGEIQAPGGRVGIVTSHFQRVLELNVPRGSVKVSIWTDDRRNPGRVHVNIDESPGDSVDQDREISLI